MSETTLKSKYLYKFTLATIKVLPMVLVISYILMFILANTFEKYVVIPHLLGTVVAPLTFLYLVSYLFRYCYFHRMFIHYYAFIELLNVSDYYGCVPLSDTCIQWFHDIVSIIFIISVCVVYVIKFKKEECDSLIHRIINPLIK